MRVEIIFLCETVCFIDISFRQGNIMIHILPIERRNFDKVQYVYLFEQYTSAVRSTNNKLRVIDINEIDR